MKISVIVPCFNEAGNISVVVEEINDALESAKVSRNVEVEKEVSMFSKKLEDLEKLLQNHVYSSRVFSLIERTTHPKVQFTRFELNVVKGGVIMDGVTSNYRTLGEQMIAFGNDSRIKEFKVSGIRLENDDRGGEVETFVACSVSSNVDPSIYR